MKAPCAVNLHSAVTVSQQHLGKRVARLAPERMKKYVVRYAFASAATGSEPHSLEWAVDCIPTEATDQKATNCEDLLSGWVPSDRRGVIRTAV